MRIAFDSEIFLTQRHGGVSRYFARTIEEHFLMGEEPVVFAPFYQNEYIHGLPPNLVTGRWISKVPRKTGGIFHGLNRILSQRAMRSWKPDVVHETWYMQGRTAPKGVPVMTTVHDMIHEIFSDQLASGNKTSAAKREAVSRADHVFCVSENTKQDLMQIFGVSENKISVSLLAYDPPTQHLSKPDERRETIAPYLLYVGQRDGYKNFSGMLEALAISTTGKHADVIAFGGAPFGSVEKLLFAKLGFREGQIKHATGDDLLLSSYYSKALALVYPSLYEGFGLPPLEAMAQGCPVISSNTSSMPEVIGDAGEYFDPKNSEMMAAAIDKVATSSDFRASLVAKGYERLKLFSWKRCASQTLGVYRQFGR